MRRSGGSLLLGIAVVLTAALGVSALDYVINDRSGLVDAIRGALTLVLSILTVLAWGFAVGVRKGLRAPIYWTVLGALLLGFVLVVLVEVFELPIWVYLAVPIGAYGFWRWRTRRRDDEAGSESADPR